MAINDQFAAMWARDKDNCHLFLAVVCDIWLLMISLRQCGHEIQTTGTCFRLSRVSYSQLLLVCGERGVEYSQLSPTYATCVQEIQPFVANLLTCGCEAKSIDLLAARWL